MKLDMVAVTAAVVGMALMVFSFLWTPLSNRGPGAWTEEKALQHAQTRADLHAASHQHAHEGDSHGHASAQNARELQERFNAELAELDAARSRGQTGARVIWWIGAAFVLGGGAIYFVQRIA